MAVLDLYDGDPNKVARTREKLLGAYDQRCHRVPYLDLVRRRSPAGLDDVSESLRTARTGEELLPSGSFQPAVAVVVVRVVDPVPLLPHHRLVPLVRARQRGLPPRHVIARLPYGDEVGVRPGGKDPLTRYFDPRLVPLDGRRGQTSYESGWPSLPAKFGPTVHRTAMLPHLSFVPTDVGTRPSDFSTLEAIVVVK
jgi:hypothetical protein